MDAFIQEVKGMSTADILLVLEDQLELYSEKEIEILRAELASRPENALELEGEEQQKIAEQRIFEAAGENGFAQENYEDPADGNINENIGPFENQDLVYSIDGVRGRHIDIYKDRVVINVRVTLGSIITRNATDGEKTIFYIDCIGIQFKQAGFSIGYLQLETASSNGNHKDSNFFDENSFTYDTTVISNERMVEVADYVKSRVAAVKRGREVTNVSVADELLKLKQLLDMGVLTQEEFDTQKSKLLKD